MSHITKKLYRQLCEAINISYKQFEGTGLSAEQAILGTMSEIGLRFNMADNTFDPERFVDDCHLRDEQEKDMAR